MKLKILKEDKNLLFVELEGESIGFVNLVKDELWNDDNVSETVCIKEHPYMAQPKLYVNMKGKFDPRSAIEKANKRISVQLKDLEKEFNRALKD